MERTRRRAWLVMAGGIAVVLIAVAVVWPVILAHIRAGVLLDRLSGQRVTRVQRLLAGPVTSRRVEIPSGTQTIRGHLFSRARGRGGRGILIVHGFSPLGDEYGDLAKAADDLAAGGFVVLTPTIPPLTHYLVNDEGMRMIGDSASWLARQTGGRVSVFAISFSGGLALVTAVHPEYRAAIRQVVALAPYDDLRRIIAFYLTGKEARPDGQVVPGVAPDPFAIDITALQFLDSLVPPEDVTAVRAVLQRSIMQRQMQRPADAHLMDELTPRQRQEALDIIAAPDALKLRLRDALSVRRVDLGLLSPHGQLASLSVPVTVITGANDPAIPTLESNWLAQDVPAPMLCTLYISPIVRHVTLSSETEEVGIRRLRRWAEKLRLVHALAPAMETADPHLLFPGCAG
ncbi:MAG: hypothetical protein M3O02_13130 [Acidobacteriota bacterium]|nr:hypothetical protein [Acidobacteriota bacterium]